MNEEIFNMELRKFLKKVGVTSQREIEQAIRAAVESIKAKVVLTLEGLDSEHEIEGAISLE